MLSTFGWNHYGEEITIIVSLCKNGRYLMSDGGEPIGIRFEYPPVTDENEDSILIGFTDLEEMGELGQEIRDSLEQQLNLDAT